MDAESASDVPSCSSAKSDVPFRKGEDLEDAAGQCDGDVGDLHKERLKKTANKEHGHPSLVNVKQEDKRASLASSSRQGGGDAFIGSAPRSLTLDAFFMGSPPSPIPSADASRTAVFDDDVCIPEGLRYSAVDRGIIVADITDEGSNGARYVHQLEHST